MGATGGFCFYTTDSVFCLMIECTVKFWNRGFEPWMDS